VTTIYSITKHRAHVRVRVCVRVGEGCADAAMDSSDAIIPNDVLSWRVPQSKPITTSTERDEREVEDRANRIKLFTRTGWGHWPGIVCHSIPEMYVHATYAVCIHLYYQGIFLRCIVGSANSRGFILTIRIKKWSDRDNDPARERNRSSEACGHRVNVARR